MIIEIVDNEQIKLKDYNVIEMPKIKCMANSEFLKELQLFRERLNVGYSEELDKKLE